MEVRGAALVIVVLRGSRNEYAGAAVRRDPGGVEQAKGASDGCSAVRELPPCCRCRHLEGRERHATILVHSENELVSGPCCSLL